MRTLVAALLLLALSTPAASAQDASLYGTIAQIDAEVRAVTLSNGLTFMVKALGADSMPFEQLFVGMLVTIVYYEETADHIARSIRRGIR